MPKHTRHPRDPNQLARRVVELATGSAIEKEESGFTKRASAGGKKGGVARRKALSPEEHSEIAQLAPWRVGRSARPLPRRRCFLVPSSPQPERWDVVDLVRMVEEWEARIAGNVTI